MRESVTDPYQGAEAKYKLTGKCLERYKALEEVFCSLAQAGKRNIFAEYLNFSPYIRRRFLTEIKGADPAILSDFYSSQSPDYREELDGIVKNLAEKYRMRLLHDQTIYHREFQKSGVRENIGQLAGKA